MRVVHGVPHLATPLQETPRLRSPIVAFRDGFVRASAMARHKAFDVGHRSPMWSATKRPISRPRRPHAALPQSEDLSVLVKCAFGRDERPPAGGTLNHHRGWRQARQDSVSRGKHPALHRHPRRLFRQQQAAGFHNGRPVLCACGDEWRPKRTAIPPLVHRHVGTVQGPVMCASIDAARQSAHEPAATLGPFPTGLPCPSRPLRCAGSRAHHGQGAAPIAGLRPRSQGVQHRRCVRNLCATARGTACRGTSPRARPVAEGTGADACALFPCTRRLAWMVCRPFFPRATGHSRPFHLAAEPTSPPPTAPSMPSTSTLNP